MTVESLACTVKKEAEGKGDDIFEHSLSGIHYGSLGNLVGERSE
jgi:hypothetical protein